jgi:hypothetical protein
LIASVGVATINYVLAGCDNTGSTSGNPIGAAGGVNQAGAGGSPTTPPTAGNLPLPQAGMRSDVPVGGNVSVGGNAGTDAGGAGGVGEGGESNAAGEGGDGQSGDGAGGAGGAP